MNVKDTKRRRDKMKNRELVRRVALIAFVGFVVLSLSSMAAFSQTTNYPNRPIKMIIPFGPGSASDVAARILGDQLRVELGQPIVAENKPGAVGLVAIEAFGKTEPDGYTIMFGNTNSNFLAPNAYKSKLSMDPSKTVMIVSRIAYSPYIWLAGTKNPIPVKTWKEFVAYAKANPGKVSYTSGGVGSNTHFDLVAMFNHLGLNMVHIPPGAGGGPDMVKALITGDTNVGVLSTASIGGFVKSGELIPLAAWSKHRLPNFPDLITFDELGLSDFIHANWMMLFARANTPADIVKKLERATQIAMKNPKVREAYLKSEYIFDVSANQEDAQKWHTREFEQWRKLVSESPIKLE
jgi:tripartite-type tricarboxylate transporter receptor subunit TctC